MGGWKLELEDKGRLTAPDGARVELPYRAVANLLALLLQARPHAVSREIASQKLWPHSPREERLTSLRQALSRLRSYLGPDLICTNRTDCSISPNAQFELIGSDLSTVRDPETEVQPPIDALGFRLLRMDAADSYEWLRAHPDRCVELDVTVLRQLVEAWEPLRESEHAVGRWIDFYSGFALLPVDLPRSLMSFSRSYRAARADLDFSLLALSGFWLGASHILSGNVLGADRICKRAEAEIPLGLAKERAQIMNLRAHVYLHAGRTNDALDLLARVADVHSDELGPRTTSEALRALYLAYAGQYADAEKVLVELETAPSERERGMKPQYVELTKAILATLDLQNATFAQAEELADRFQRQGSSQMELYTRELLVVRSQERSRIGLASSQRYRIHSLRQMIGMAYTQWDFERLTPQLAI